MPNEREPMPSAEMRRLVGTADSGYFDNPTGKPVYPDIPEAAYRNVLDFGCGCGRLARQMIQQHPQPGQYLGLDVHRGMVEWCQKNLTPCASQFKFQHHNVFSQGMNPKVRREINFLPFPCADKKVTLLLAHSVFTHLLDGQAIRYFGEAARVLSTDGIFISTWFLFDKRPFPMMQEFQNSLYINAVDPTNAVIYDCQWFTKLVTFAGLKLIRAVPPTVRGFQWQMYMVSKDSPELAVELPEDSAPYGIVRPPS